MTDDQIRKLGKEALEEGFEWDDGCLMLGEERVVDVVKGADGYLSFTLGGGNQLTNRLRMKPPGWRWHGYDEGQERDWSTAAKEEWEPVPDFTDSTGATVGILLTQVRARWPRELVVVIPPAHPSECWTAEIHLYSMMRATMSRPNIINFRADTEAQVLVQALRARLKETA